MLHVSFTAKPFDKQPTQCAVVSVFADIKPLVGHAALLDWRLNGRLSRVIIKNRFEGHEGETLLMPTEGRLKAKEILVVGMGNKRDFHQGKIPEIINRLLLVVGKKKIPDFMISFTDILPDRFEWRNAVRLLVSNLHEIPLVEMVRLCETNECVRDAKRRHMDFGLNVGVSFETLSS